MSKRKRGHESGEDEMSDGQPKLRKHRMTNWYSPVVLITTAIRVLISTVFGEFADRREAIAASNAIRPQPFDAGFNYSGTTADFWFDYLADTGDGWSSTYAMARLVSGDGIEIAGEELPRGKFLVLGGDEVYPFASREDYDEKFLAPFDAAYKTGGTEKWPQRAYDLFALPGNHDWYDGLSAFFGLFCRRRIKPDNAIGFDRKGRVVAGRDTKQTRSYFVAKLPGDWWIWGTDSQLEGYIDQPQIDFFIHAARYWMKPASKLILCVDGPHWVYADPKKPEPKFENFSYLERLAGSATDEDGKPMGHALKLVLTGDSHHYSRYTEEGRQYVTCGGGGAFLHPTHHLKAVNSFQWRFPPPGQEPDRKKQEKSYKRTFTLATKSDGTEALFPSRAQSKRLSFKNFGFAALHPSFTLTLFGAYAIFHWLLDFNAHVSGRGSLPVALRTGDIWSSMLAYWSLAVVSPAAILLVSAGLAAYIYAADKRESQGWWVRVGIGSAHALAQAAVVTVTTCIFIGWVFPWAVGVGHSLSPLDAILSRASPLAAAIEIGLAAAIAALLSATTYGIYLLIMLNGFRLHWNEGFSSFAYEGFKCMLRMKIGPTGELTIYPIGLENVPADRSDPPKDPSLDPVLIEGPIVIR
jgi:hypothetical protein